MDFFPYLESEERLSLAASVVVGAAVAFGALAGGAWLLGKTLGPNSVEVKQPAPAASAPKILIPQTK